MENGETFEERIQHMKAIGPTMTIDQYASKYDVTIGSLRNYASKYKVHFKPAKRVYSPNGEVPKPVDRASLRNRISKYTIPQVRQVANTCIRDIVADERVRQVFIERVQEIRDNSPERLDKSMAENLIDDLECFTEKDIKGRMRSKEYMPKPPRDVSVNSRLIHVDPVDTRDMDEAQRQDALLRYEKRMEEQNKQPKKESYNASEEYRPGRVISHRPPKDFVYDHRMVTESEGLKLEIREGTTDVLGKVKTLALHAVLKLNDYNRNKTAKQLGCSIRSIRLWLNEEEKDNTSNV